MTLPPVGQHSPSFFWDGRLLSMSSHGRGKASVFLSRSFCLFWFFTACGILVPWPGIEQVPPALEVRSPNHELPGKSWKLRSFRPLTRHSLHSWGYHSHHLITSQRPHILIPSHPRVGFQHMNFLVWGHQRSMITPFIERVFFFVFF